MTVQLVAERGLLARVRAGSTSLAVSLAARRSAPLVIAVATAVVLATSLYAVVRQPASDRVAILRHPVSAFVVDARGSSAAAVDGEALVLGQSVRTDPVAGSTVDVVSGGRVITLGAGSELRRRAQSVYDVVRGEVLVDRHQGPGVQLTAGDVTIDRIGRGSLRVERLFSVRVGTYDADAVLTTTSGAILDVPELHQVVVAGSAVPAAATALTLLHDAIDQRGDPTLLAVDDYLVGVGRSLDADPTHPVALASAFVQGVASSAPPSERTLPVVIARASRAELLPAVEQARSWRDQGGSWGVVAALCGAGRTDALAAALADLVDRGQPVQAGGPGTGGQSQSPRPGGSPSGAPSPGSSGTPGPTHGPTPTPTPTPSPTAGTVQDIINTVTGLLPTPSPSLLGGVLGGVLGGG